MLKKYTSYKIVLGESFEFIFRCYSMRSAFILIDGGSICKRTWCSAVKDSVCLVWKLIEEIAVF